MTLVVLIVSSKRSVDYSYVVTKNDEFALSLQGNVVVFIVDTLDNEDAQNYVIDRYCEELKDFTYFDNMIGGGAPTALGVPLMLTGYQYDTTQSLDDSQLYADFKNNGGITVDAGNKTFTLYHKVGAHVPYEMNEQCVDVGETETSLDKQIQGAFRYINEYMQQL